MTDEPTQTALPVIAYIDGKAITSRHLRASGWIARIIKGAGVDPSEITLVEKGTWTKK